MDGISRREAGRRAGVDESTVRKALNAGALKGALLSDGSLHPTRVLKLLAENVQRGKSVPMALTTAKTRRLRAQVAKLSDGVAEMRASTIAVEDARALLGEQRAILEGRFAGVPWDAGNSVAGLSATDAHSALRDLIVGALERVVAEDGDEAAPECEEEPEVDLNTLSPNDLTARRISLQAESLEIETALARGDMRVGHDIIAEFEERNGVAKSLLMAMPGRLAQAAELSTPDAFEALVREEIDAAFREF